jgi:hypothetical protein
MLYGSFGGRFSPGDTSEVMRLLLAACISRGTTFRRSIIDSARNPALAPPIEIGIDKAKVVACCHAVERIENRFRASFALILIFALFAWSGVDGDVDPDMVVYALLIIVCASVLGAVRQIILYNMLRAFSPPEFSLRRTSDLKANNDDLRCVATKDQNVVLYRGYSPFDFAGIPFGGWTLTVDTEKRTPDAGSKKKGELSVGELEKRMTDAIARDSRATECHPLLAIHGCDSNLLPQRLIREKDSPGLPRGPAAACDRAQFELIYGERAKGYQKGRADLSEPPVCAPEVELDPSILGQIEAGYPNLARRYLWFLDITWGGEIVLSHMLRVNLTGRILFVENARYLLTPVKTEYRTVDSLPPKKTSEFALRLISGLIAGPFHAIIQPLFLFGTLSSAWSFRTGGDIRHWREAIKQSPSFNYGAEASLRRATMSENFTHFAQKIDLDRRSQSFNKIVIEELARYLEEHGIDVTDLRNKEMTIFNSGIFVQSGDVSAQTMAVGDSASAQTTLTAPVSSSRKAAPASAKGGHQ